MPYSNTLIGNEEMEKVILQLKVKANRQLDKIDELKKELDKKDDKIRSLEDQISKLADRSLDVVPMLEENELIELMKELSFVINKVVKDNAFIPYKNYTKNSLRYCKVEKTIFDNYMDKYVSMDRKLFLQRCVDIGFIKVNDDGKFVFNDNQIRIYFFSKAMIKLISGEQN